MSDQWPPDEKQEALDLYMRQGLAYAVKETGIPRGTISSWASVAGLKTTAGAKMTAAIEETHKRLELTRIRLAEGLLLDAAMLRRQLFSPTTYYAHNKDSGAFDTIILDEPTAGDKQRILTAAAVAIDKAQLLAGEATQRTEDKGRDFEAEARRQRILGMTDELARRREAKKGADAPGIGASPEGNGQAI